VATPITLTKNIQIPNLYPHSENYELDLPAIDNAIPRSWLPEMAKDR
jgi:hypothetical protein